MSRGSRRRVAFASLGTLTLSTALVFMVWQALTADRIDVADGCGYDGEQYCAMAEGTPARLPFVRRVLVPYLARLLTFGSVVDRFFVINCAAVIVVAFLSYRLTLRLHPKDGHEAGPVVAGLTLLSPSTWHLLMAYPVLTDHVSLALGIAWLLAVMSRRPWWSAPFAVLAVLAREAWAPVILVALVYLLVRRRLSPLVAVTTVAGVGVAAWYCYTRPGSAYGIDTGLTATVRFWILQNFQKSADESLRFAWMTVVGLGFVVIAGVIVWRQLIAKYELHLVLLVAGAMAGLAVVGGGDTDRLLLPSMVLASAAVVAPLLYRFGPLVVGLLMAATLVVWRPWMVVSGDPDDYARMFALRVRAGGLSERIVLDGTIALLLLLVTMVVARQRTKAPPTSA